MTPKKNTREGSYPALLAVESVGNFHPLVKKNSLVRRQIYFGKLVSPVLRWLWHDLLHSLQRYAVRRLASKSMIAWLLGTFAVFLSDTFSSSHGCSWKFLILWKLQFKATASHTPQAPALHSLPLSSTEVDVSYEWHHWLAKPGPSPLRPLFSPHSTLACWGWVCMIIMHGLSWIIRSGKADREKGKCIFIRN